MEAHYGKGIRTCKMGGKTLPEVVTGKLNQVNKEIWEKSEGALRAQQP